MKKVFCSVLSFLIIASMCLSVCGPISVLAEAIDEQATEAGASSSSAAPKGYVPKNTYIEKADVELFETEETPRVLLVEDVLPWDSYANQTVLGSLTEFDKVTTEEFLSVDLSKYGVIAFANDQPFDSYENYSDFKKQMETFASIGGVIVFGACDAGWADGELNEELPGGITKKTHYVVTNYIEDYNHPIVTGSLTNNDALLNGDLTGSYCSHVSFDEESLPAGSKIILRDSDLNRPTLVEYPLGKGRVIASGLTWEFTYDRPGGNGSYGPIGYFAKKSMEDMFKYAIRVSSIDVNDVHILKDYYVDKEAHHIIVTDDDQNLIEGAKVTIDNDVMYTDAYGMVSYSKNYDSVKTVTVTADGYKPNQTKYMIKKNEVRYIFMVSDDGTTKPYVTIASNLDTFQDLRYHIMRYKANSGEMLSVDIRGEWGNHPAGKYVLYQDSADGKKGKKISKSANTFSFAPGKVFTPGLPIKIKMVSSDGTESDPVATQLYVDEVFDLPDYPDFDGKLQNIKDFQVIPDKDINVDNEDFGKFFPKEFKIEGATLPVEVSASENLETGVVTYRLVIGAVSYEKKKALLNDKSKDGEWSNFVKDFKETVSDRVPEDRRKKKRNEFLRKWTDGKENGSKWQSNFKIEVDAAGYGEFSIDKEGNFISSEGGFVIDAGGKGSIGKTFPTAIGPIYFEASLGAELEFGVPVIVFTPEEGLAIDPSVEVEVVLPSITLGGGYGVRNVATIGVEGNGNLKMEVSPDWKGKINASASVALKIMFLIDTKWTFAKMDPINLWSLDAIAEEWMLDGGEMKIASRNYNALTSEWNGNNDNSVLMSMFDTQQEDGLWLLQNYILPDSVPQIENVVDDKVMVFQYDDSDVETGNHIKLMYSYYDDGEWSDPLPIIESETSDYYFDTLVHNDELYVVWQKSGEELVADDAESLLAQALASSEICFAKWDSEANEFEYKKFITDNNYLDMMPKLVANDDTLSVIWVQNQANEIGSASENIICKLDFINNAFGSKTELGRINGSISELAATYVDDKVYAICLADDTDSEGNIYGITNGVATKLSLLNVSVENLLTDNNNYYWYSENCIYKYNFVENKLSAFKINELATSLKVVSNGDKSAFVWISNTEEESAIKASMLNDGEVSDPIYLYRAGEGQIKFFDAVLNDDNSWSIVLNIENDEDVTAIGYIHINPMEELSLEYAYADETKKVDDVQPVVFAVKNTGDSEITTLDVMISDENGNEYVNTSINCSIAPGAEQEFTEEINVEGLNEVTTFTIFVSAGDEINPEDNFEEFVLGCPDISLSISQYKVNNKLLIAAKVSNGSNTPANTAISIVEDSLDGITLDMKNIGLLDNGTDYMYNYEINLDDVKFNEDGVKYYYIKLDTIENDLNPYDNYYILPVYEVELFEAEEVDAEEVEIIDVTGVKVEPSSIRIELSDSEKYTLTANVAPENATNKEVKWTSENTEVVRVTDNGEIVVIGVGTAVVRAETYDGGFTDEVSVTVYSNAQYKLDIGNIENGTVEIPVGEYTEGEEISISAQPDEGYEFKYWTSSDGGVFAGINASSTTFIMPGNDTTITAVFGKNSGEAVATLTASLNGKKPRAGDKFVVDVMVNDIATGEYLSSSVQFEWPVEVASLARFAKAEPTLATNATQAIGNIENLYNDNEGEGKYTKLITGNLAEGNADVSLYINPAADDQGTTKATDYHLYSVAFVLNEGYTYNDFYLRFKEAICYFDEDISNESKLSKGDIAVEELYGSDISDDEKEEYYVSKVVASVDVEEYPKSGEKFVVDVTAKDIATGLFLSGATEFSWPTDVVTLARYTKDEPTVAKNTTQAVGNISNLYSFDDEEGVGSGKYTKMITDIADGSAEVALYINPNNDGVELGPVEATDYTLFSVAFILNEGYTFEDFYFEIGDCKHYYGYDGCGESNVDNGEIFTVDVKKKEKLPYYADYSLLGQPGYEDGSEDDGIFPLRGVLNDERKVTLKLDVENPGSALIGLVEAEKMEEGSYAENATTLLKIEGNKIYCYQGDTTFLAGYLSDTETEIDLEFTVCDGVWSFEITENGEVIASGDYLDVINEETSVDSILLWEDDTSHSSLIVNSVEFSEIEWEVTFDANGGECDMDSMLVKNKATYGDLPVPTREGYTFNGWYYDDVLVMDSDIVTEEHTLVAEWIINKYTYKFIDDDGTILKEETADYGTVIVAEPPANKENTAKYTYTFVRWDGYTEGMILKGDVTFTAVYKATINKYTYKFLDEDGTVLKEATADYGTVITAPVNPEKADTAQFDYTFAGWDGFKAGMTITEDVTFKAKYNVLVKKYTYKFVDEDGTVLKETTVEYGTVIVAPEAPEKADTAKYNYTFAGWNGFKEGMKVEGHVTFIATYTEEINKYTYKFLNDDGTVLVEATVEYGTVIVAPENPEKATDNTYIYSFAKWDNFVEKMTITEDIEFVAIYDRALHETHTETTITDNKVAIELFNIAKGSFVIVRLYDDDENFTTKVFLVDDVRISFANTGKYKNAKVMVWESLTSLSPVCEAEVFLR